MTLTEKTKKIQQLDAEYDALTEKIQAMKAKLVDGHGYSYRNMQAMIPTACRRQFDRQTEIENEIKTIDS